ncbi:MAG: hypothetical protein U1E27_11700, partial [Kiritimatiellia bacterium]|nr:hypothetical protein [Kiritimatiellia bacterium]
TLRSEAAGTPLEIAFTARVTAWSNERKQSVADEMSKIRTWIEPGGTEEELRAALARLESYSGPYGAETQEFRAGLAENLREQLDRLMEAQVRSESEKAWVKLRTTVAEQVLRGEFDAALAETDRFQSLPAESGGRIEPALELRARIAAVAQIRNVIMDSFQQDIGRSISLGLMTGTEIWEVKAANRDQVELKRMIGPGEVARLLKYEDLSLAEKFRRLGTEATPDREIMRGLISLLAGRDSVALQSFENSDEWLGSALAVQVRKTITQNQEVAAERAYGELIRLAGAVSVVGSPEELIRFLRRKRFTADETAAIQQGVARFRTAFGTTDFALNREAELHALEGASPFPREVHPDLMRVAIEQLRQANPQRGPLLVQVDNTPEGIEITLAGNPGLVNLQPLQGLPLIGLDLSQTRVRDLAPLKGMPLRELNLSDTKVTSLAGLEELPLVRLLVENCPIDDLTPLRAMPLRELMLGGTRVMSILPLTDKPLRTLSLRDTGIQTLRPLRGAPLESLSIAGCQLVDNLDAIKGAPLRKLDISGTSIKDLSPLLGAPLEEFTAAFVRMLRGLEGLERSPLKDLVLLGSPISELRPIASCPLATLDLRQTLVEDLSPLAGSPVLAVYLEGAHRVRDLRPLLRCERLSEVILPGREADIRALIKHPSITRIGFSADDLRAPDVFWASMEKEAAP